MDAAQEDRILAWNRAVPRYTSYPTVPVWRSEPFLWNEPLDHLGPRASVYVHIPFCKEQGAFCGCTMVVAGRQSAGDRYLDSLEKQIRALGGTREVERIHLGGGTPTWLSSEQITRLFSMLDERFTRAPGAEVSVEIDPDVTTDEQLQVLASHGVNRLSIGVQSIDPDVLGAIRRPQDPARIAAILVRARELGMSSINLDLVIGLPKQTLDNLAQTLAWAAELRPERLAIYAYAHVPWLKRHQRQIDEATLPSARDRLRMSVWGREYLQVEGYQAVGMDHYALPEDPLALAARERTLHRNFMGYTTRADLDILGLGMSAISEMQGLYVQQPSHLFEWYQAVEGKRPPFERGWRLSLEDQIRKLAISELMCNFELQVETLVSAFGEPAREIFQRALEALLPYAEADLVTMSPSEIWVTEQGKWVLRPIVSVFDAYLNAQAGAFSKAV